MSRILKAERPCAKLSTLAFRVRSNVTPYRPMNKPLQFVRDLSTWIVPVLVLALAVFVFNLPLLFGFVLAILIFAGLFFMLNPRSSAEERQDQAKEEVAAKLDDTRAKVAHIRALANGIQKQDVRAHVLKICDLADGILKSDNAQTVPLATATRLNYTFAQMDDIVQLYVQILFGKVTVDPAKRDALMGKIEGDILNSLETSLHDFAIKLDQGEIVNLEATIRVLESTLKLEGLS